VKSYLWLVLVLGVVLLIPGLGNTTLWIYDEVRNAECAREMYERGDWIVPTFNGELRAVKPPLHYYFMFAGFELFGITETGARFFSAIFGILTVLITYFFTARFTNHRKALIASLILLSSTHYLFQFRLSVPDPYLIFFNVLAIFSGYAFFQEKKTYWILLCGLALGLGTLAKGPVAIAIPGAIVFLWVIWTRRFGFAALLNWRILPAGLLMIAVAVPWYWLVHKATDGAFTTGFFIDNNINRFSSTLEGHGGIFLLIPLFVLLGMLPASVFSHEALRPRLGIYKQDFFRLAMTGVFGYILFYSFSGTKLPNYPFPSYPFLAILIANLLDEALQGKQVLKKYPFFILLFVAIALPIGAYIGIEKEVATTSEKNLAFFLLILVAGVVISLITVYRGKMMSGLKILFGAYFVFHLFFLHFLYPSLYKHNPLNQTIDQVRAYDQVVGYKNFHPSYTFYLPNRIPGFDTADSLQLFLQKNKALVITRTEHLEDLKELGLKEVARHHDIFELPTTILLTNKE